MGLSREVQQAVSSVQHLIDRPHESDFEGLGLFEDPTTRAIYSSVQRGLSLKITEIHKRINIKKKDEEKIGLIEISDKLVGLSKSGFVNVTEAEKGFFPFFSPSAKGVRISKKLGF